LKLLLLDRFWGGRDGPGIYIHDLAQSLLKRGHRVGLVFGKKIGDYVPEGLEPFHITDLHTDLYGRPTSRRMLQEIMARFEPDIASAQCLDVLWFAKDVEERCPLVAAFHTHAISCPNWSRLYERDLTLCEKDFSLDCLWHTVIDQCGSPKSILQGMLRVAAARSALRQLTAVQAVTPYMGQMLQRAGVPSEKLFDLVYPAPGFDPTREYLPPAGPNILFVGRLHQTKGCHLLIEAAARLQTAWTLTIVGGGPQEKELRELAARLGVTSRCNFFTGQETVLTRAALSQLYLDAAVICVPSIWGDPAPLVRLEAMAHGRPLVVFDAGGVAACVEEGVTGFIVPRLDKERLSARLEEILTNQTLSEQMGRAALSVVQEKYNPETLAKKLEVLYAGFITRHKPRSAS
jgi:glycosyltransferase involved in cell wall biosynthesis